MNKEPLTKLSIFHLLKKIKRFNLGSEIILLDRSINRFLNKDIKSKINLPPFNNSAVDGYALCKNDIINNNKKLIVTDRVVAGQKVPHNLKKGEVARIFTGAYMPLNSKTVIMQENVILENNKIKIKKMPVYGENCRLIGEDIKKGKKIIFKGKKINSTNINLIAAIGKKMVDIKKKIKIGFYTSGNELSTPTENLRGSQINNSNYYSLNALLNLSYAKTTYLGILKDEEKIITKSILSNIKKYNVIITAGGASVGEEDHLIKIIKKIGKVFFWKAAIKPGRPLAIGKIKNTIIICLPGNPVSVHLLYGMIIKPFLEYLCGGDLVFPRGVTAKTDFGMKKKNRRLEWLRVNFASSNRELIVSKYKKQGSGMISSVVYADGILEIPENISLIFKGDSFTFYSFDSLFK